MTEPIVIDYSSRDQYSSWKALLELHEIHPYGWTLIGGLDDQLARAAGARMLPAHR